MLVLADDDDGWVAARGGRMLIWRWLCPTGDYAPEFVPVSVNFGGPSILFLRCDRSGACRWRPLTGAATPSAGLVRDPALKSNAMEQGRGVKVCPLITRQLGKWYRVE